MTDVRLILSSSGTAGAPHYVGLTARDWDAWVDVASRCFAINGVSEGAVVIDALGFGMFTGGVPVVAAGSDVMPAFWSRESPYRAPLRVDDPKAIARLFAARKALGLGGGMLIANPVPESDEIPAGEMAGYIEVAYRAAQEQKVAGKAVTPFLLAKILELTDGASLKTNIALVENNARLAARIAKAL